MQGLLRDIRFSFRLLFKRPGFTVVIILTLALGIGANTALFTVVKTALLDALPYAHPEQIVHLREAKDQSGADTHEFSYPDFVDLQQRVSGLQQVAVYQQANAVVKVAGTPEQVGGALVSANFFQTLGVSVQTGRLFSPEETVGAGEEPVILTQGLWKRCYGGQADIIGQTIDISGLKFTVVGVLPADFQFAPLEKAEAFALLRPSPTQVERRFWFWVDVIGRIKPEVSTSQLQAELGQFSHYLSHTFPESHRDIQVQAIPLQEYITGPVRPLLLALGGVVALILLLACTNIANLVLAQATTRSQEIAVRLALGASRWQMLRQLLIENLLLTLPGGCLGLALAHWSLDLLVHSLPQAILNKYPFFETVQIQPQILLLALGVTIATGVGFSLVPLMSLNGFALQRVLRLGRHSGQNLTHISLRQMLVVIEVASAFVLLVGTGLLVQSLISLLHTNPGFNTDNLLTCRILLDGNQYREAHQRLTFYDRLQKQVTAIPGVKGMSVVSQLPLTNGGDTGTPKVVGRPETESPKVEMFVRTISHNYFQVMEIPLATGRWFSDYDQSTTKPVVVINQTLAARVFPNENPIGKQLAFSFLEGQTPPEIVGVVGDENVIEFGKTMAPVVYFPLSQDALANARLIVRSTVSPDSLKQSLPQVIRNLDPTIPVFRVATLNQIVSNTQPVFIRRYALLLFGLFGGLALVLAIVGVYGVLSYFVMQRKYEIGIRLALGATPQKIIAMIGRQAISLMLIGILIGTGVTYLLSVYVKSLLFSVSSTDPATFGLSAVFLFLVGMGAALLPGRQATQIDPMIVLREQ